MTTIRRAGVGHFESVVTTTTFGTAKAIVTAISSERFGRVALARPENVEDRPSYGNGGAWTTQLSD